MTKSILTVCIPTYNRPTHIQRQVRDVLKQIVPGVELLVLDNHSDTPVKSYFTEEELSLFTIKRHLSNIGGDANNAHCLEMVDHGWVWLLGDDDQIRPDAVNIILGLIKRHPDCCYINTGNKRDELCTTLDQFLNYFRMRGVYGKAFFQTACIFNMDRMMKSLYWYYVFLSSQMGQFYFVLKHMELNKEEKCYFYTDSLITDKEPPTWSGLEIINNSTFIFDKFYYLRKKMRPTIFFSLVNMYLDNIGAAKVGLLEKKHYLTLVIKKVGIINLLFYNYIAIGHYIMCACLPKSTSKIIHDKIAGWYNNKVRKV